MIEPKDIIKVTNVVLTESDMQTCKLLSRNTFNTWQGNRTDEDILADTCLGKFAEKAIQKCLARTSSNGFNPYVAFYDDFRIDDYKLHNSSDFIFCNSVDNLLSAQKILQDHSLVKKNSSKLSAGEKKEISELNVKLCEIKATRLTDKHKIAQDRPELNYSRILRDDFLDYPAFFRKSHVSSSDDYIAEVQKKFDLSKDDILLREKENLSDWYFRVYIKENEVLEGEITRRCDAYIIGSCPKQEFVNRFHIKKMVQNNKSEAAIYLAVPLSEGLSIKDFINGQLPSIKRRNHLSTTFNPSTIGQSKPKTGMNR